MTYEELETILNAHVVEMLTAAWKPYFAELDNLIVNGDPNGDIESGRLLERHFPDLDKPDDGSVTEVQP